MAPVAVSLGSVSRQLSAPFSGCDADCGVVRLRGAHDASTVEALCMTMAPVIACRRHRPGHRFERGHVYECGDGRGDNPGRSVPPRPVVLFDASISLPRPACPGRGRLGGAGRSTACYRT